MKDKLMKFYENHKKLSIGMLVVFCLMVLGAITGPAEKNAPSPTQNTAIERSIPGDNSAANKADAANVTKATVPGVVIVDATTAANKEAGEKAAQASKKAAEQAVAQASREAAEKERAAQASKEAAEQAAAAQASREAAEQAAAAQASREAAEQEKGAQASREAAEQVAKASRAAAEQAAAAQKANEKVRSQQKTNDTGGFWVLNTKSKKIHYPSCGTGARISSGNRATSNKSLQELIRQGYTTCGNCFK